MDTHDPTADLSLEDLRLQLAPSSPKLQRFDGWTDAALTMAAEIAGIDPAAARFAFQGEQGSSAAMAMVTAWAGSIDRAMAEALRPNGWPLMPIRQRITALVQFRLDEIAGLRGSLARRADRTGQALEHPGGHTARLAQRGCDVAARGRYRDRLQPLHQARRFSARSMLPRWPFWPMTRARTAPIPGPSSPAASKASCASRRPRRSSPSPARSASA